LESPSLFGTERLTGAKAVWGTKAVRGPAPRTKALVPSKALKVDAPA